MQSRHVDFWSYQPSSSRIISNKESHHDSRPRRTWQAWRRQSCQSWQTSSPNTESSLVWNLSTYPQVCTESRGRTSDHLDAVCSCLWSDRDGGSQARLWSNQRLSLLYSTEGIDYSLGTWLHPDRLALSLVLSCHLRARNLSLSSWHQFLPSYLSMSWSCPFSFCQIQGRSTYEDWEKVSRHLPTSHPLLVEHVFLLKMWFQAWWTFSSCDAPSLMALLQAWMPALASQQANSWLFAIATETSTHPSTYSSSLAWLSHHPESRYSEEIKFRAQKCPCSNRHLDMARNPDQLLQAHQFS